MTQPRSLAPLLLAGVTACSGFATEDAARAPQPGGVTNPGGNTNVNLGGAQDFGYFRRLLDANVVPDPEVVDDAGFFAEHHTPLPEPSCGERICLQAMLGVMGNLLNGANCTLLQLGLNSPLVVDEEARPPLTLAVVVDTSGSMQGAGKMDFVVSGLTQMINALKDEDQIALIRYSSTAELLFPMADVGGNRNALMEIVQGLTPDGSTNIWDGLELGYQEVLGRYDLDRQNRVILLSDGQPTAGIVDIQEILDASRPYNSDGVGLTTIGLGTDFNLELMRGLSEQGDGNFYFVEDAAAVEEVFTEELSYFTVPVAFDLDLQVRAGADFSFGAAYGSRMFQVEEWGGTLDIPSVFLAHRKSSEDVTENDGRRGGGSALLVELMPTTSSGEESEVAVIDVSFRDPIGNRTVEDTVVVTYPYPATTALERGYFENDIVTKSFVMLNILVGMREACDLFHRGNGEGAVGLLRRLIAAAADYEDDANDGEGDTDIRLDIELMQQLMSVMVNNGALDPPNPPIPEDPWPAD